jgi:hypothetical protein
MGRKGEKSRSISDGEATYYGNVLERKAYSEKNWRFSKFRERTAYEPPSDRSGYPGGGGGGGRKRLCPKHYK